MIIRIEPSGGSFRGAGLYYLHDKSADNDLARELKPKTDERVWFTDTRNCANFDPEHALDEMWRTAEDQQLLKRANGVRASGRTCTDPVKTIAIAWHEQDQPTPEHMIAAADAYLKHMRWDGHQAVYIGHRDTDHRHIHIVLNRVHPETGRTLDDYRDFTRSEKFGLAYEKEHGKLWCVEREIKAAKRERREPDLSKADPNRAPANEPMPRNVFDLTRASQKQFDAAEQSLRDSFAREQAELKEQQKEERLAFFEDGKRLFRAVRVEIYREVRAEFKEQWAQFYKDEKAAREFDTAAVRDALLSAYHFAKAGDFEAARHSLHDRFAASDDIAAGLAERKEELVKAQKEAVRSHQKEATDILMESRKAEYEELLARQRGERASMKAAHAQGQSAARDLGDGPQQDGPRAAGGAARSDAEQGRDGARTSEEPKAAESEKARGRAGYQGDRAHAEATKSAQYQEVPPFVPVKDATGPRLEPEPKVPFDLTDGFVLPGEPAQEPKGRDDRWQHPDQSTVLRPTPPIKEGAETSRLRDPADAGAAVIGAVADYIADQLGELIAPTPPEVGKAEADRQIENEQKQQEASNDDPWDRYVAGALKQIEEEQAKRTRDYWTERDKSKDWERDR